MGALPPKWLETLPTAWEAETFIEAGIASVLWGVAMHLGEKRGHVSFGSAD